MDNSSFEDSTPQLVAERKYLKPVGVPNILVQIGLAIVFVTTLYTVFISRQITDFGAIWSVVFSAVSLAISIWVTPRYFTLGYLTSMLPFLINWRIAAMADGSSLKGQWVIGGNRPWLLMIVSAVVFVPFALQFIAVWRNDRRHLRNDAWLENLVWGATLVRVYFGFNELGHATEKIFAGYHSWSHMTNDVFAPFAAKTFPPFTLLSSAPGLFVIIAGLIEFALAIGIGFGFMTRLAGAGGVLFLLIATIGYGKEWFNGYGWAGAGWEYVMLLIVFFISFVFTGAGKFSIDSWLLANNLAPKWLIPLGFTKSGRERFEAQSTKIADYAKQYAPHSTTARF